MTCTASDNCYSFQSLVYLPDAGRNDVVYGGRATGGRASIACAAVDALTACKNDSEVQSQLRSVTRRCDSPSREGPKGPSEKEL